ncbi:DEAD/DEAH box helicase [Marivirga lumbricoides]|uniref:DEAD/DEAH box helicase n=1 Tax=Marivirga lumbricoides TaxID=1046115 RepID=A0ABQ1L5R8_9BACT|nr:DEAD/DEAH box helicase [Marivirga lumbricoides]
MQITIQNEKLLLSSEKIIFWESKSALFLADAHLGKSTHFRKAGIAVPSRLVFSEIDRLKALIDEFRPQHIYFLGDLFHSHLNVEWQLFVNFVKSYPSHNFILIKGNHDILPESSYQIQNFTCEKEPYLLEKFLLSHHPLIPDELKKYPDTTNLAGHLHPGIHISGKGRNNLSLPCFAVSANQLILPAFGRFTGLAKIRPKKSDAIYAIANDKVIEIKQ